MSTIILGSCKHSSKKEFPKNDETIVKIEYLCEGGENEFYEKLSITADSIHYLYHIMNPEESGEYHEITPENLWQNLLKKSDLSILEKIENGESIQYIDGADETYSFITTKRTIVFMNGRQTKLSNKEEIGLEELFTAVKSQTYECQEKSNEAMQNKVK